MKKDLKDFSEHTVAPGLQVFSRSDLEYVASLLTKWDAYAVLDEVYEHLVFEGFQHISLRSLPGMQERAVRVGSAGKTFSFTGWKVPCKLCVQLFLYYARA